MRRKPDETTRGHIAALNRVAVPRPTPQFQRRAWLAFQRALNPLAPPKPLPAPRTPGSSLRQPRGA